MSGETNSDFSRAIAALTIFEIWRAADLPGQVPRQDGQYKSPFRDERTGSFSILGGGKGFHDFGSGAKGGLKDFAKLAWPNLPEDDLRERMIEVSGIVRTPKPAGGSSSPANTTAELPPALVKAAKNIEKRERERREEDAVYADREEELRPWLTAKALDVPAWPACVEEHWQEGHAALEGMGGRQIDLAAARGWPASWVVALLEFGLLSYPWERWANPGDKWARRQKAFRVDLPILGTEVTELRPIGYHQRGFTPAQGNEPAKKLWVFVPSFPKVSAKSALEEQIIKVGLARGLLYNPAENQRQTFIPPLPFVLGDVRAPKVLVLLEGQWDAITFYGACGWFNDSADPAPVAVLGIRGSQGMDAFLIYWVRWISFHRPLVWIVADNDAAGGTWRDAPAAAPGELRRPSFADKLKAAGARDVLVSWLSPGSWGKDFNDYYRAAQPGPDKMFKWMRKVGVLTAKGEWA